MNRRDLLLSGAAAAATHTLLNLGCSDAPGHAETSSTTGGEQAPASDPARAALARDASACVLAGEACLSHCLEALARGDTNMGACGLAVREMLAICRSTLALATTQSKHLPALAKLCNAACNDCASACEPHAGHHAVCKACLDACRATAVAAAAVANV